MPYNFLNNFDKDFISIKDLLAITTRTEQDYKKRRLKKAGSLAKYLFKK